MRLSTVHSQCIVRHEGRGDVVDVHGATFFFRSPSLRSLRLKKASSKKMDERAVPRPRTSASAKNIWTREYTESQVSPDGRILRIGDSADTPFGRQERPFSQLFVGATPSSPIPPPTPTTAPLLPIRGSRTIERLVLQDELRYAEDRHPSASDYNRMKSQLVTMMRINKLLTHAIAMECNLGGGQD